MRFWVALWSVLVCLGPVATWAEDAGSFYKDQTIRWIVPYRPGGSFDAYSRLVAPFLATATGAKVEIVNLPGAGSLKGTLELHRAPADGLHIGMINAPSLTGRQLVKGADAGYAMQDFGYIGRIASEERVLVVSAKGKWADATPAALIAAPLVIGATGVGGSSYLDAFVSTQVFDAPWRLVSGFDNSPDLRLALLRGDIDAIWGSYTSAQKIIAAGDAVAILRAGILDVPALDNVAEVAAHAVQDPGLMQLWFDLAAVGRPLVAAPGVAEDRLAFLREALERVMADSAFLEAALAAKRPVAYLPAPAMNALIQQALAVDGPSKALLAQALEGGS